MAHWSAAPKTKEGRNEKEVNRDGISLKFSRGALDDKVRISDDNPNMVIIESESFANALRREI